MWELHRNTGVRSVHLSWYCDFHLLPSISSTAERDKFNSLSLFLKRRNAREAEIT
jgi:hypothetical protein